MWWACSHVDRPVSSMSSTGTWDGGNLQILVPNGLHLLGKSHLLKAPEPSKYSHKMGTSPNVSPWEIDANHKPSLSLLFSVVSLCSCRLQAAAYTLADSATHEAFMPFAGLTSVTGTSPYLTPNMLFFPLATGFEGFFYTTHMIAAAPWALVTFSGMCSAQGTHD